MRKKIVWIVGVVIVAVFAIYFLTRPADVQIRDSRYFPSGTISGKSESGTRLNQINLWNHPTRRTKLNGRVASGAKIYIIEETENHYHVGVPETSLNGWLNREFVVDIRPPHFTPEVDADSISQ